MNLRNFYVKVEGVNSLTLEKINTPSSNKVLFMDRDGVMIEDTGHISTLEQVSLCDGLNNLLRQFKDMGYIICVVTNQSSVARGIITRHQYEAITGQMLSLIREDLWPDYIVASFFHSNYSLSDDEASWRKPDTGMFEYIRDKVNVDIDKSFMIGDKLSDMKAGSSFGIKHLVYIKSEIHANEEFRVKGWEATNAIKIIYSNNLNELSNRFNY